MLIKRSKSLSATFTSARAESPANLFKVSTLILLRHGQSSYNLENRFTGWIDVDLTDLGRAEATLIGNELAQRGLRPDIAFTSVLVRAVATTEISLREMGRSWIPVFKHWRLNERHYGALQGLNKAETAALHGDHQVHLWRRSYDVPPPILDSEHVQEISRDPRYREVAEMPATESLKDVLGRVMPYYLQEIEPTLNGGRCILVSAHGNSLRALVKHIEGISDAEIPEYEFANGQAIIYNFDSQHRLTDRSVALAHSEF